VTSQMTVTQHYLPSSTRLRISTEGIGRLVSPTGARRRTLADKKGASKMQQGNADAKTAVDLAGLQEDSQNSSAIGWQ